MIENSDDEINFPPKVLLTIIKIANLRQGFANYLSTDIKLSKFNLYKIQVDFLVDFLVHW